MIITTNNTNYTWNSNCAPSKPPRWIEPATFNIKSSIRDYRRFYNAALLAPASPKSRIASEDAIEYVPQVDGDYFVVYTSNTSNT